MKQVIEQIKKLSGVKLVESAGENMAVVVFEPETQDWIANVFKALNFIEPPQYLKPEELVKGEIYADEYDGEVFVFRFKKIRKCGLMKTYSWDMVGSDGDGITNDDEYEFGKIRHATPEEKQLLLKFEETL